MFELLKEKLVEELELNPANATEIVEFYFKLVENKIELMVILNNFEPLYRGSTNAKK